MNNEQELKLRDELAPSPFCAPHYIEELGCDGLTSLDIAASLGAHIDTVRRRLRESNNETLKSLKLLVSRKVNINGLEYDEFFLSTAAAKFFVARYENEIGDGYLEYLILLDAAVEKKYRRYKEAFLAQSKKALELEMALKETKEAHDTLLNEPVTGEELSLLVRTVNSNLKRHGRLKKAYKNGFNLEIITKFYLPGEDPDTYTYLPRKNFKDAILYARDRKFDWRTTKEFV